MTEEERRARIVAEDEKVIKERLTDQAMTSQMQVAESKRWGRQTGQAVQARLVKEVAPARTCNALKRRCVSGAGVEGRTGECGLDRSSVKSGR